MKTHAYQKSDLPPDHGETMPPCATCNARYKNARHNIKPVTPEQKALESRRYAEKD